MPNPLRAVVRAGRIELEEPVGLPDGTPVLVTLDTSPLDSGRQELYRLLDEAEEDFRNGDRGVTVEALRELRFSQP